MAQRMERVGQPRSEHGLGVGAVSGVWLGDMVVQLEYEDKLVREVLLPALVDADAELCAADETVKRLERAYEKQTKRTEALRKVIEILKEAGFVA